MAADMLAASLAPLCPTTLSVSGPAQTGSVALKPDHDDDDDGDDDDGLKLFFASSAGDLFFCLNTHRCIIAARCPLVVLPPPPATHHRVEGLPPPPATHHRVEGLPFPVVNPEALLVAVKWVYTARVDPTVRGCAIQAVCQTLGVDTCAAGQGSCSVTRRACTYALTKARLVV